MTFLNQESTRLLARARQAETGELYKSLNTAAEMNKSDKFLHPEVRSLKGRLEEEGREGQRQEETISRLATHHKIKGKEPQYQGWQRTMKSKMCSSRTDSLLFSGPRKIGPLNQYVMKLLSAFWPAGL